MLACGPGTSAADAAAAGSGGGAAGTGSPDGAAGTAAGAAGTGSTDGAAGTGSTDGAAGTGSADGAAGTGSTDGGVAGAFAPTVCSIDGWCWYHPAPQGNDLLAIWGSGPTDVWAVGDAGTILHWNGTAWSGTTGLIRGALRGVWGTGPSDVWAVGDGGAVLRYDGTKWNVVDAGTKATLRGVWGASATDVWVVGDDIVRWNGTTWTTVAPQVAPKLTGVWGSAANDVWLSGPNQYRWNGTTFTQITEQLGNNYPTNAVWGASATKIFQVGTWRAFEANDTMTKWLTHPVPVSITSDLSGIWGAAADDVWVVGSNTGGEYTAAVAHYDGALWKRVAVTTDYAPKAIWGASATDIWTVGINGEILRYDGAKWTSYTKRATLPAAAGAPSGNIRGVWAAAENDAWAPTESGALHFDGAGWTYPTRVNAASDLYSAFGFAPNDVWISGSNNTLLRWNGTALANSGGAALNQNSQGLWGTSSTNLFVASGMGLFRHDGTKLTREVIPNEGVGGWDDVWGFANGDLWVVRAKTVKRRHDGAWSDKVAATFAASPKRIWGATPEDLWLTGTNITLHWNGTTFESVAPADATTMICGDAGGAAANDVWLTCNVSFTGGDVLKGGLWILHWNGTALTLSEPGLGQDLGQGQGLTSIFARAANDVWATGFRRAILRKHQ